MNVVENKSKYSIEEMLTLAGRDGNKKRKYLLLNKLQAKYLPTDPCITLDMFDELADQLDVDFTGKRVAVVGFAETATAIGTRVAERIYQKYNTDVVILPTTREELNVAFRTEFLEEHSHATEQYLYTDAEHLNTFDYLIFVEDEVTTGNTICNCVKQLRLECKVLVLSLLNCMDTNEINRFHSLGITPYWLIKTTKDGFDNTEHGLSVDQKYQHTDLKPAEHFCNLSNPRLGVNFYVYDSELSTLVECDCNPTNSVLVLGTEECMYPAIRYAAILKRKGIQVQVSATTRVPALVSPSSTLKERYCFKSLYDNERLNYVYNLSGYDTVIVVTDGKGDASDLCSVVASSGCNNLHIIRLV